MDWQPVSTVPKDGKEIRLRRKGVEDMTYVGRWHSRYGAGPWWTNPWTWHLNPSEWEWQPSTRDSNSLYCNY